VAGTRQTLNAALHNDRLLPWFSVLTIAVVTAVVVAALYLGQVIFIPMALGLILSFLLQPLVRGLEKAGFARVPAVITIVLLVALLFAAISWNVVSQLQELAGELRSNPTYINNLERKITDVQRLGNGGVLSDLQAITDRVTAKVEGPEDGTDLPPRVLLQTPPKSQLAVLKESISPLMEPLGTAALVIVLVIFMLISREDLRNRIIGLLGQGRLTVTTRALDDAARRIGRYLLMQFIINATYGLILGVVLTVMGVPFALLWGMMAALFRYIPYVGPWLGAALPVATSFVAFEGWTQPALVVASIVGLELVSNMVMEPLLYGHSVGVSAVALILAAAFWTFLWGPIGLVMATPLTVCLLVLGQHVPQFSFFAVVLGDQPALSRHMRYYQRLLARDRQEANSLIQAALTEHRQWSHVCDEILIPALVRTRRDRYRERITAEDEAYILETTREILSGLAGHASSTSGSPQTPISMDASRRDDMGRLPAGAAEGDFIAGEERAFLPLPNVVFPDQRIPVVLGCPAHHEVEEVLLKMLTLVLEPQGLKQHMMTTKTLPADVLEFVRNEKPRLVFVAVIPPSGLLQASYLCRRLRKSYPELPIVVGYWGNKSRFDEVLVKMRSRGASIVTTSISQTQKQIAALVEKDSPADTSIAVR
jgi:predicted PurR-regulated permease PerM